MDPAYEIEQAVIARQKPINDVMDRGDSSIQQFYRDTTVFVTGGSGFIGKQLVEKLFRSCDIKKMYMLLRSKKGKTIQERLCFILSDPLYDCLREKKPQFADRIVPVEGDVADIRLGLSDNDWDKLTDEVNVIFHMAATVNFDAPLKEATVINVRGTREALTLARQLKHLKCFNHTSTAFAHTTRSRIDKDVEEKFYPTPVSPDVMIGMVEHINEERLNAITPDLIEGWPNTYTFTKAIAEELIKEAIADLPACIVKPPIVFSTYMEPAPGWIDLNTCMSNPAGIILGGSLGIMHTFLTDGDNVLSYAPLDYVNNAIIAASWDAAENRTNGVTDTPIYTISTSKYDTNLKYFKDWILTEEFKLLASPKILWHGFVFQTSSNLVYWLLTWLLHYIPGYAIDALVDLLGVRPRGMPSLVKIYTRMYKLTLRYQYFTFNFWNIRDDNLKAMIQRMSPEDRLIYNCNVATIDFKEQFKLLCIGLRRYIVKDGLQGAEYGYKKIQYLKYANYIFFAAYGYLIYLVLYIIYALVTFITQFLLNTFQ